MGEVSLRIHQIGEGLKAARLVAFLKQPGDSVKRDEPIYQMETDKAVMDVESPHAGRIVRWLADPDTVLAIGAEVLVMDVADAVVEQTVPTGSSGLAVQVDEANRTALKIPQIGECRQEARLVAVLKQPGDRIERDEAIYQMETDKAVMDVESPIAGRLVQWLAEPDTVLSIGAEVALIETDGPAVVARELASPVSEPSPATTPASSFASGQAPRTGRRTDVPPRTRAYAKGKGLSDAVIESIPASGAKLMSEDVDAFLAGGRGGPVSAPAASGAGKKDGYSEQPMGPKPRVLMSRLTRGYQLVVPGTMTVAMQWGPIEQLRREYKSAGKEFQPSAFTMFAYAAALATKDHPTFRSTIVGDGTVRTYEHIHLGIAVALPGDELVLAVVDDADTMDWRTFADACRDKIDRARGGQDQVNESVTLSLTNMQAFGIRDAVAVVVPPSVATVFLGEPYNGLDPASDEVRLLRYANLGITFDHRLINGVGAAHFQNALRENVENIRELVRP